MRSALFAEFREPSPPCEFANSVREIPAIAGPASRRTSSPIQPRARHSRVAGPLTPGRKAYLIVSIPFPWRFDAYLA
jgi:hypothetical protein